MKVILLTDMEHLGSLGDVVEVKPGFARNYLLPRKYALPVTPHNLEQMENRRRKHQLIIEQEKLSAMELKERLEKLQLVIRKKAGENEVLFGSVTAADIEEKLAEHAVTIERKKIHFDEPIKRLGHFTLKLKLVKDVEAQLAVEVVKEGEEPEQTS